MNNINLKNNLIIIGPSYMKESILKEIDLKYNIKYIDEYELKDKYLFTYENDILTYIDSKYNIIPEIGRIVLDNLYEIDENKEYSTDLLNNLSLIKKDLINNNKIKYNNSFKKFLNKKDILVIDSNYDNCIKKIITSLEYNNNISYYKNNITKKNNIDIYEFNTLEDEVIFVANKIVDLINNGIDINKIKINKINNIYKTTINRIFKYYNINIDINKNRLYDLEDTKLFLNSINDNMKLNELNDLFNRLNINDKICEKIVSIINKYINYDSIKDIKNELIYELKNTYIKFDNYTNIVEEIDYKNYIASDDEYIFMMGLNNEEIPNIHKDNSYLSDKELYEIDSMTSNMKNKKEETILYNFINNTKNIYLSYKLSSNFNEYIKSNFIDKLDNVSIKKEEYKYNNKKINNIILGIKLDNYVKYNEKDSNLNKLYTYYSDNSYMNYNNNYNGIPYSIIKKQLDNKLNLSYTNISTYFKCKFRFLLDNIYKLAPYKETISQRIGNLFHDVLYEVYKNDIKDYDKVINEVVDKYFDKYSNKDKFYIEKYRKALKQLISLLDEQLSKTDYHNEYFEEWFSVEKENDLNIKILGKIDKVLTLKDNDNTYVIVVDYKTGALHGDFNKVVHGFDMQLLYYLYLIKNSNKINNPKFTGMYLQSIMTDVLGSTKNKTYEELIKDNMKLFGYTISSLDRLYEIDHNYNEDSYIKSMRVKKDGSFYSYSKVLSEEVIEELINIVDNNINEAISSINNSSFDINPKKIGNDLVGCEYCPFKDICYMNNNNIVDLKVTKNLEFLGGDE